MRAKQDQIILSTKNGGHVYKVAGKDYPSVTTIQGMRDKSSWMVTWAVNEMEKHITTEAMLEHGETIPLTKLCKIVEDGKKAYLNKSDKACQRGTDIHKILEAHIVSGAAAAEKMVDDSSRNMYLAFLDWADKYEVEFIEAEHKIYHKELKYAGTLDLFCKLNIGKGCSLTCIVDFKSSKRINSEYVEQIAAYREAFNYMRKLSVENGAILRLDKLKETPVYDFKMYTKNELDIGMKRFNALNTYYQLTEGGKK